MTTVVYVTFSEKALEFSSQPTEREYYISFIEGNKVHSIPRSQIIYIITDVPGVEDKWKNLNAVAPYVSFHSKKK